jgi:septum formation protein
MLILASRSAARKTLLEQAGVRFDAQTAAIDERGIEADAFRGGADGRDVAVLLAQHKALAVSASWPDAWVIGADQTLTLGTTLLHKPADMAEAAAQLDALRGKTHRLHAAVSLARGNQIIWSQLKTAELTMRAFSDRERDDVLRREGESVLGSVGGYRLEGPSIRLFDSVTGDYFTILGLPLLPLLAALRLHAPEELL